MIWDDFCSWYLEWVKPEFEKQIEKNVYTKTVEFFEELMQLLHPFMPFITEEIYHQLKERKEKDDLTIKLFSTLRELDLKILKYGEQLKSEITTIRDYRNKTGIANKDKIKINVESTILEYYEMVKPILVKQTNGIFNYVIRPEPGSLTLIGYEVKISISTDKKIDPSVQKNQLLKDLKYQKGFLLSVEKKLNNERFVQNVKPEVIELEKKKKADAEAKIKAIQESLSSLGLSS